jgi:alpha-1,2-mannosyltransferase
MVMQALASIFVGLECLSQLVPDVFLDSTGAAFSYPCARLLAGCTVMTYTHYPMISAVS